MSLSKKIKIALIGVLVLLVAGMTMFGVFGFNQTVDNKSSYEMQVSVDQNVGKSIEILKNSSKEAVAGLGNYSVQELNDGALLIYKFNADVSEKISDVKTAVQTALNENNLRGVKADVMVYENYGSYFTQILNVVLAIGIATIVIFAYALIMNKLSGGVAVLCSSVLSAILFLALMALTRIPAQPYLAIFASATTALTSALALAITSRYRSANKENGKASACAVCESVHKSFKFAYIILAIAIALLAVITGVIGFMESLYIGLAILVAGVASLVSAVYMTPFIWALIKGKKN